MPELFRNLPSVRNKTATCDIWVWTPHACRSQQTPIKTLMVQIKHFPPIKLNSRIRGYYFKKLLFGARWCFSEQPLTKTVINCLIPPLSHSAVSDLQVDNCAQWPMAFTCTACIVMVWGYTPLPFSHVGAQETDQSGGIGEQCVCCLRWPRPI